MRFLGNAGFPLGFCCLLNHGTSLLVVTYPLLPACRLFTGSAPWDPLLDAFLPTGIKIVVRIGGAPVARHQRETDARTRRIRDVRID